MVFEPYAADLASRVLLRKPSRVLEIAAGTGVVTRHLARMLPEEATIVATDLNQPMLDQAAAIGTTRPVEWRHADAMELPFPDETFDAVVCQFGVMFFPDKPRAFAEAKRVLRHGGSFFFSVWDRLDENEFAETVSRSLAAVFPEDPPSSRSVSRTGTTTLPSFLATFFGEGSPGRRSSPPLSARSRALSASTPAMALCQGTPLRNEIEARDASRLDEATAAATSGHRKPFRRGCRGRQVEAHIVVVER